MPCHDWKKYGNRAPFIACRICGVSLRAFARWRWPCEAPKFDGPDVTADDAQRLGRQLRAVRSLMKAGPRWWTLREIAEAVKAPEASVSARLRDLRKPRFGGSNIERRRLTGGTWQYRMTP